MLGPVTRPLRALIDAVGREVTSPLAETEGEVLDGVRAIREATGQIERHVAVIETLATSVGPLAESVDRLTATLSELLTVLGPVAAAEHGVERAERVFHLRRQHPPPADD